MSFDLPSHWALLPALLFVGCSGEIVFPADGESWPGALVPTWTGRPRFAITNNYSDEISFVNLADGEDAPTLLTNLPAGNIPIEIEAPHHIAASPDRRYS